MLGIQVLSKTPPTLSTKQYNVTGIPRSKDQNTCKTDAAKLMMQ